MIRRDRFTASLEKRAAVNDAEKNGQVADSMDVRAALIAQLQSGEKTLDEIQEELRQIKRNAKKNGKVTRSQAWSRG